MRLGFAIAWFVLLASPAVADAPRLRGTSEPSSAHYTVRQMPGPYATPYPEPAAFAPQKELRRSPTRQFEFEAGVRYWHSSGKLAKTLYDDPRASGYTNSRLTYSKLTANSGEAFGRADHVSGVFVKGYVGLASLNSGRLQDEDFPPAIAPYSSTLSDQRDGDLRYFNVDVGYTFVQMKRAKVGVFLGYNELREDVKAFGCAQNAANPFVCVPEISSDVLGISEHSKWQSVRLGLVGELDIAHRLKLTADAAWLPYAHISAHDIHWLRLGTGLFDISGPIMENGSGWGYQLEAMLSYALTDRFQLGVGGRYWHMQTKGGARFEEVIVGWPFDAVAQPLDFSTNRYGVFAQGSYRFGG